MIRSRPGRLALVLLALVFPATLAGCQDKLTRGEDARLEEERRLRLSPPPPAAEVLALLAPWRVGTEVQGYKIAAIYGVVDGSIWILLERRGALVRLEIVRAGEGPPPPFSSPPYFVYISAAEAPPEGLLSLAESAGAVLSANRGLPVPAGLQTFHRSDVVPSLP